MAVTISLAQAEEIIRCVNPKVNIEKAKPLQRRLLSTAQSLPLWNSLGNSGTATDRERAARKALTLVRKASKNGSPLTIDDVFDRECPLFGLVRHDISDALDPIRVQEPMRSGAFERRLTELCSTDQKVLIEMLEELRTGFKKEQQENSTSATGGANREADRRLDIIYMDLATIYEGIFGHLATISNDKTNDVPSGPFYRFLVSCFSLFNITHQSPNGIRMRMRRLTKLRRAHLKDYDFGFRHIA